MEVGTIVFLATIFILAAFQVLLVLGLPLGEFAWGGQHKVLPRNLRVGSIISIGIYGIFIAIFLSKVGAVSIISNEAVNNILFVVMTGYFALGTFVNLISRSKKERLLMTPVAFLLFLTCLSVII